jgi:hypothetical protein
MFYISLVLAFFLPHPPQKCPLLDYIPFYCAPINVLQDGETCHVILE